jgi:hypothetical protein
MRVRAQLTALADLISSVTSSPFSGAALANGPSLLGDVGATAIQSQMREAADRIKQQS